MDDSTTDESEAEDPDWLGTLIRVYLFVCKRWAARLHAVAQRQSNNSDPDFTDEEVLIIYLFGLIRKRETIKDTHEYAEDHFPEWFPNLPSYAGYLRRLNRLSAVFAPLTNAAIEEVDSEEIVDTLRIADSFPVMIAKEKRSTQAKVAPQIADKGYCSSGILLVEGYLLPWGLPWGQAPRGSSTAARNDAASGPGWSVGRVGKRSDDSSPGASCPAGRPPLRRQSLRGQIPPRAALQAAESGGPHSTEELTPPKKTKGQDRLSAADKLLSEAVSRVRQPIESLFNWIDEKTGLQTASKVRSSEGLMVHAFGRFAAAMFVLALNP